MTERTARQKIVDAAGALMEKRGYHGTGLNEIIQVSQAPRGSLYYYFPAGKEELAAAAARQTGEMMVAYLERDLERHADIVDGLMTFFTGLADHVVSNNCQAGAPLAVIALETAGESDRLREACRHAYQSVQAVLERKLLGNGYTPDRSRDLALLISAAIEGAVILARVEQAADPIRRIAAQLGALLLATPHCRIE
jgi:TetR/AcrR family transcriptional repressor of lmrAB and yxaGH operons